jgi:hypothetical protein
MSQVDLPSDWRTYAADLFKHYELVLKRLERRNPSVDYEDLNDAFVKAILEIAAKPQKFDQSRETKIEDFLAGASQRVLLQTLRTHRRRKEREKKRAEAVGKDAPAAREVVDALADCELARQAREVAKTDDERSLLRLWELGHGDIEIGDQLKMPADKVKLIRDRLMQRLRRMGKRFGGQNQ